MNVIVANLSANHGSARDAKIRRKSTHRQPRVIYTGSATHVSLCYRRAQAHGTTRRRCRHRPPVQYLNNIIEQDHRAIKKRVNAKHVFRTFGVARRTIEGYEALHMLRKGSAMGGEYNVRTQVRSIHLLFKIADATDAAPTSRSRPSLDLCNRTVLSGSGEI